MISRTAFCSAQPATMREARQGPMPATSVRRSGVGLDDLERALAESSHDALGHGWADAAHLTGGEIFLDPLSPGRGRGLEHVRFELKPMHAVADPSASRGDPLARPDCRRMAHHGHEVAFAARLHLEHAKAVLAVVEGDALDCARQRLHRRASLHLIGADHLVHAPAQDLTTALAPSNLLTPASTRAARLASMHGNFVLYLFLFKGEAARSINGSRCLAGGHSR